MIAFFFVVVIGLMVLNNPKEFVNADNNEDAGILSKNTIDYNKDLRNEKLLVKMRDGRYYEETEPGPFMGANWEGRFVLQLLDDIGKTISQLDLNQAFGEETLKFQYAFDIEFEDDNHDGLNRLYRKELQKQFNFTNKISFWRVYINRVCSRYYEVWRWKSV